MAYKRPSDSLVAFSETKRSRNEIAALTNKDKQLLEVVRAVNITLDRVVCIKMPNISPNIKNTNFE